MLRFRLTETVLLSLLLLGCCNAIAEDSPTFGPRELEGSWSGKGKFVMPITGIRTSVTGEADFRYDSTSGYLRTSMKCRKFLFSYADSGYFRIDSTNDSIATRNNASWEVWDGFGKHVIYSGTVRDSLFTGSRREDDRIYRLTSYLMAGDTLVFRLECSNKDGDTDEKARFTLHRVR